MDNELLQHIIMCKTKFLSTAILMMISFLGISQDIVNDMQKIIVRNVTVIDRTGNSEDMLVTILINEKILELVTMDKIALTDADITFDAKGGFILGKLEVGNPAGFIILDQDPRINEEVLLDTKSFAVFACAKGEIVLNKLIRIDDDSHVKNRGWRSYSPPAIALPLSYQNKRKWNVFRTKPFTLALGGAILIENTRWLSQDTINEVQVGELSEYQGGSIRGLRFGVAGMINFKKPWTYVFYVASQAFERGFKTGDLDEFILYDYRVNIPIGSATLSIGKTKETISMSRLMVLVYEPSQQERASVADGLLPARNIGIVINNTLLKERMTWAAGVFNNWYEVNRSFSENPTVFSGRITGLPFISEDENNLLHLGIASRYSNATGGIQYQAKTEIFSGPVSVDTDLLDNVASTFHYGFEMAWRNGPFILMGEYIQSNVSSSFHNDPQFMGYYLIASYVFSGEMRPYNKRSGTFDRVKVANGINSGGWGELEAFVRWSSIDLNDKSINGGEMNTLSLGLNWNPIQAIQLNVNYRYSTLDRFSQIGSNHGLVTRLVFLLE